MWHRCPNAGLTSMLMKYLELQIRNSDIWGAYLSHRVEEAGHVPVGEGPLDRVSEQRNELGIREDGGNTAGG